MTDPTAGPRSPDPARTPLVGPPPSLGGAGGAPPPWDGAPPPYVAPAPPPPRRRRWMPVAVVAAVAVLAGGFGIASVLDGDGADTPEAAVEALFAAVDDEDVIGALEALDPGERGVLLPAMEELADEARRLELASPDLDLGGVAGVDLQVDGLTYETEELGRDLVAVDLTGGSVTASADVDALPLGALVREVVADDVQDPEADRIDLEGARLVARRTGGGWYVSAGYSVAEQARRSLDPVPPVPDLDAAIAPTGADSPEAAVRQAVDAAIALDVERLVDLVAPSEVPALHHYGPLLVAEADTGSDGDPDDEIELVELQLDVASGPNSTAVVTARSFEVRQTYGWSDGAETATWTYDGSCLSTTWEFEDGPVHDDPDWCGERGLATPALLFSGGEVGDVSVLTVEEGGRWFVSPTRSMTELILGPFRSLDRDDARRTVRFWAGDWWVAESDSFWEACGVDRPSPDASSQEGETAHERCLAQLPDDHEGAWFGDGGDSTEYRGQDEVLEYDDWGDDWEPSPEEEAEMACYQADPDRTEACLAVLVDAGTVDEDVLLGYRCGRVYDDLYQSSDEPTEEQLEAADDAFDACWEDIQGG